MRGGVLFVQSSYTGIGLLREAKAQAAVKWPAEISSLVDNLAVPHRKTENLTYDGVVVLLAATYETYVRDTIEAICREIECRIPNFDGLNEKIRSANARATGSVLSRHSEKRYSQFNYLDLSKCLGTCFLGSAKYQLNSGPLAAHDRNLDSNELKLLFKRVGIENLWGAIGATSPIQTHFTITDPEIAQKTAAAKLDEFILLRNQMAHAGSRSSSIGPDSLIQWLDFFLTLMESLLLIVSEYCKNLVPVPSATVVSTVPGTLPPVSHSGSSSP